MPDGPPLSAPHDSASPPQTLREIGLRPMVVLLSVSLIMTVFWYFGRVPFFRHHLTGVFPDSPLTPLYPFMFFSVSSVVLRLLVPMAIVVLWFKRPLSEFGYGFKGSFDLWWVYLGLFLAVLPVVWAVGHMDAFQNKYPLGKALISGGTISLTWFLVYQLFYFMVFVSGESFWRGYIIFGLRPTMGLYAIPVMILPYVMGHFGKPYPETFGAILTGGVLGYLALRHGNFWLGVLVHWGVALAMDLCALYFRGVVFV